MHDKILFTSNLPEDLLYLLIPLQYGFVSYSIVLKTISTNIKIEIIRLELVMF